MRWFQSGRLIQARGSIHRRASVEAADHDFEQECVVVLRTTHHVYGATSRHITPLSIETAVQLQQEPGDLLARTSVMSPRRCSERPVDRGRAPTLPTCAASAAL
jgi:hypothetical protein